jgi:tellurite resistance protein
MKTISHHSALIYVMVMVSASDGNMSDREMRVIGNLAKTLPVFRDFEEHRLLPVAQECASILQEQDGPDAALGLIKGALPPHLRETAYMLALEVAMADARIAVEEVKMLEVLRRTLHLDKLVAAALERGARARYQIG